MNFNQFINATHLALPIILQHLAFIYNAEAKMFDIRFENFIELANLLLKSTKVLVLW